MTFQGMSSYERGLYFHLSSSMDTLLDQESALELGLVGFFCGETTEEWKYAKV